MDPSLHADASRLARGLYWDRAWSLVNGCAPVSAGCDRCWAARDSYRMARHPNPKISEPQRRLTERGGRWTGEIRTRPDLLDLPLRTRRPTVWAVWTDLFHEDVPASFIERSYDVMYEAKRHIFLVLTKRPIRARNFLCDRAERWGRPPNVWLGTTAERQRWANERVRELLATPAAHRWVSVEPMLGPVNLGETCSKVGLHLCEALDWVVCGGESGSGARQMEGGWVQDLRDQCEHAGVPFFFKQWGSAYGMADGSGRRLEGREHLALPW